ncbi:hypothetical protein [Puniceicoccus vermicola]|uniref:Uncharacterized protein n=1 Tax=Puniceicoccus vermicola TaxID=388746 RepID=A0A7X1B2I0_9BACT|nr:hypothetical protein [Puniceicoccus vermicola]MBC2604307.1 hypothetical protein [Puniceicoccus vermicola]
MNAETILLVFEICFLILFTGFGVRFVFYDEDGPNLDAFYKKYLNGRVRKKYAEFTRTVGFLLLTVSVVYLALLIWNQFSPVVLLFTGD